MVSSRIVQESKLPSKINIEKKQEAVCLCYDNNRLLVVLNILKLLFSAFM